MVKLKLDDLRRCLDRLDEHMEATLSFWNEGPRIIRLADPTVNVEMEYTGFSKGILVTFISGKTKENTHIPRLKRTTHVLLTDKKKSVAFSVNVTDSRFTCYGTILELEGEIVPLENSNEPFIFVKE